MNRKNRSARSPTLGGDLLSSALCLGAIAIGITALTGYVLGNATIAALMANGKPVAAVTAIVLIAMGAGLFALRWAAAGVFAVRCVAIGVTCIITADVLSSPFSVHNEGWQLWAARGGVYLHQFPITSILSLGLSAALFFLTTRKNFASHVIASIVLLTSVLFLFAYVLEVPSFLDPSGRLAPVPASTLGLSLISAAVVMARPRGWAVALLSRTSAGMMSRLLLPAALAVPFLALALRNLIADRPWFTPEVGLTVIVAVNVFFGAAIVLGAGAIVHKRASESARLASIVDSSGDAIIGKSMEGVIESWNAGAERMYGYSAAEAIGRSIAMLAPPGQHDEIPLLLERLRQGERVDSFETVRVARDGRRVDVLLSVSPVVDDTGNIVGASTIAHDITGRKNDEGVIRRLAEQHAVLLATSTDGFWLADLDGLLLDVNEAYCRMSGYSREELLGMTLHDLEAFETPEETSRHIRNIAESGFDRFETKHRTKDNRIIDIEASVSPLRTTGQVLGFARDITLQKQDITEKKLAEERIEKAMADLEGSNRNLEKSEAALKEAQRAAHLGHWAWSAVTGAAVWSDETYRILGIPVGSAPPSFELYLSLADPADRRILEEEMARMVDSGEGGADRDLDFDARITTQTGVSRILAQRVMADRDASGSVVGFHGTIQDITRRVATEQALRDSEVALAEAQQIAHIGSWILHPQSGEASVSAETFRIFGIDPRPVVQIKEFLELVHEEDRAAVAARSTALLGIGRLDVEFRIATARGERVVRAVARQRETGDSPFSLIGTIQDITDQKAAEEALRQHSESLQRSNAELDRFNRAAVGRELRMIELKQQINDLYAQSGRHAPYVLPQEHALAGETS